MMIAIAGARLIIPCLAIACVVAACGRTTVDGPTSPSPIAADPGSPSPQFPSLRGHWIGSHGMTLVNRETGQVDNHGCEHAWDITSQNGGEFSGSVRIEGSGSASDRFCTYTGTVMGVMTPDGTVTSLRFDPMLRSTGCTHVSGDETFSGSLTGGTKLAAEMSDQWRCEEIPGYQTAGDRNRTTQVSVSLEFPAARQARSVRNVIE